MCVFINLVADVNFSRWGILMLNLALDYLPYLRDFTAVSGSACIGVHFASTSNALTTTFVRNEEECTVDRSTNVMC